MNPKWPIILGKKFDETYFVDKGNVFFQVTEDSAKIYLKIPKFSNKFFVTCMMAVTFKYDDVKLTGIKAPLKYSNIHKCWVNGTLLTLTRHGNTHGGVL